MQDMSRTWIYNDNGEMFRKTQIQHTTGDVSRETSLGLALKNEIITVFAVQQIEVDIAHSI